MLIKILIWRYCYKLSILPSIVGQFSINEVPLGSDFHIMGGRGGKLFCYSDFCHFIFFRKNLGARLLFFLYLLFFHFISNSALCKKSVICFCVFFRYFEFFAQHNIINCFLSLLETREANIYNFFSSSSAMLSMWIN